MSRMLPVKILPPAPPTSTTLSPPRAFLPVETTSSLFLQGLVVGVESFGEGLQSLPGAPRDASRLYLELSHRERYPGSVIKPLLDPTRSQFAAALQELCEQFQFCPSGNVLLYLSTHGIYQEGVYHLCFADSRWTKTGYKQTVTWPELRTWLAPLRERTVIVLLDCCRQISTEERSFLSELPENREDIVLKGEQWAVFTGASFGEKAWEYNDPDAGPEGLFTRSLLAGLLELREKTVRLSDWYEACRKQLQQQVQQSSWPVTQEPRMYVGHLGVGSTTLLPSATKAKQEEEDSAHWFKNTLLWLGAVLLFAVGIGSWAVFYHPRKAFCEIQLRQQWVELKAQREKGQKTQLSAFADFAGGQKPPLCTVQSLQHFSRQTRGCSSRKRRQWLQQRFQRERSLSQEEKRWCQRLLREATKGSDS